MPPGKENVFSQLGSLPEYSVPREAGENPSMRTNGETFSMSPAPQIQEQGHWPPSTRPHLYPASPGFILAQQAKL